MKHSNWEKQAIKKCSYNFSSNLSTISAVHFPASTYYLLVFAKKTIIKSKSNTLIKQSHTVATILMQGWRKLFYCIIENNTKTVRKCWIGSSKSVGKIKLREYYPKYRKKTALLNTQNQQISPLCSLHSRLLWTLGWSLILNHTSTIKIWIMKNLVIKFSMPSRRRKLNLLIFMRKSIR